MKHNTQLNDDIIKDYDSMLESNEQLRQENAASETTGEKRLQIGVKELPAWMKGAFGEPTSEKDQDNGLDEYGNRLYQSEDRESRIASFTDESNYSPENIEGNVYVDAARKELSNKNSIEKAQYEKELMMAHKLSEHFNCKVFMLPPTIEDGFIYVEKKSNPDSVVKGFFVDFKQINTDKPNSVQRAMKEGIRQADAVYIELGDNISIDNATRALIGQVKSNNNHEGFGIVISDSTGNFKEYQIIKKRLVESPFIGGAELAPLSNDNYSAKSSAVKSSISLRISLYAHTSHLLYSYLPYTPGGYCDRS